MKNQSLIIYLIFILIMLGFGGYSSLSSHYPGYGFINVIANVFKEPLSFDQAIQALKEGHRIRSKHAVSGYTKVVVIERNCRTEKFGTYLTRDNKTWDHCTFSIEDVLATDWIIDDKDSSSEDHEQMHENQRS